VQPVNRLPADFADRRDPSRNGNGNGHLPLPSSNGHSERPHNEPIAADVDVQEWEISRLKEHPKQREYFPNESLEADSELAADIRANGLKEPIKILPDGTILSGHRRVLAAKSLGWTTIDVEVLDLDRGEAEAVLINENCLRRQLTDLQQVRCAKRRVELAKSGKCVLPEECRGLTTCEQIGKLLGRCRRQANRYLRVLETPSEVQHAVDAGHLSMQDAGRVANLEKEKQRKIAAAIKKQGSAAAKAIVEKALPSKAATRRGAEGIWYKLRHAMVAATQELPGHVQQVGRMTADDLQLIQSMRPLLKKLEQHAAKCVKEAEEDEAFCSDVDDIDHGEQIDERLAAVMDTMSIGQGR
jgi:ParB family chromosome partitioning protein